MQTSIFLAKLLGPTMALIGLAVLINARGFRDLAGQIIEHPGLLFLSSVIFLPAGIAMVLVHNIWTDDWRVLVTLFGWLLVVSSVIRLIATDFVIGKARNVIRIKSMPMIAGGIWLIIGLIFCFFGYR